VDHLFIPYPFKVIFFSVLLAIIEPSNCFERHSCAEEFVIDLDKLVVRAMPPKRGKGKAAAAKGSSSSKASPSPLSKAAAARAAITAADVKAKVSAAEYRRAMSLITPWLLPSSIISMIISYRSDQLMGRDALVGVNTQWLNAATQQGHAAQLTITLPPFSQPNIAPLALRKFSSTIVGLHNMPLPSIKAIAELMEMPEILQLRTLGNLFTFLSLADLNMLVNLMLKKVW
jgi:hypothetical protein